MVHGIKVCGAGGYHFHIRLMVYLMADVKGGVTCMSNRMYPVVAMRDPFW